MGERELLKQEIVYWLSTVIDRKDKARKVKAFQIIRDAAHRCLMIDEEIISHFGSFFSSEEIDLKVGDELYCDFARSFAPRHYNKLVDFIKRYEIILEAQWEEDMEQEEEEENFLERQRSVIFHDDYEYGEISGEVVIGEDSVSIQAFEFQEGFKESLPSGGKYQGKGNWMLDLPCSKKNIFANHSGGTWDGMPILYEVPEECPYFEWFK